MTASPSARRQRLPAGCGPGMVIGQYRITGLIGQGGMGAVYAAEHTLLRRTAAIKVLLADLSQRQDMVLRFFNEARAAAAICHPGIIEIYDVGWSADRAAYIVMEHLRGESLSRRAARGRLVWHTAFSLARQIAGALAAAHGQGIVHRDLKPDNVFLVTDPEVPGGERIKLLDFGIAKLTDENPGAKITRTGVVIGTPTYMAPEQCRGVAVDHRADLYSLGCLIFKLCAGRAPFVSTSDGDVLASHIYSSPPLLGLFVPEISLEVETLVQRLLAKRPEDRPQCAEEVIQLLDAATRGGNRANRSGGRKAIVASTSASRAAAGAPEITATGSDTAAPRVASMVPGTSITATGSDTAAPRVASMVPGTSITATGSDTAAPRVASMVPGASITATGSDTAAPGGATMAPGAATPTALEIRHRRSALWLRAAIVASIIVVVRDGPALTAVSPTSGSPAPPPPPSPDPTAELASQMKVVITRFVAWSHDHAGAPCPSASVLGLVRDPWGHPLEITCTRQPANQIIGAMSAGPDGAAGTADDIGSWQLGDDVTELIHGARWAAAVPVPKPRPRPIVRPKRDDDDIPTER